MKIFLDTNRNTKFLQARAKRNGGGWGVVLALAEAVGNNMSSLRNCNSFKTGHERNDVGHLQSGGQTRRLRK